MNLLQYIFFQHALLGSLLASIACGIIGTYIVTRRLVFISGGITHASFGGIGLGLFAGISPILSAAVFSVLSAFGVEWLSRRKDMREDSAIAVFWTLGMALGIMFSFLSPGFAPDLSAYLFGNILTINQTDLWMLGILALLLTGFFYLFFNPFCWRISCSDKSHSTGFADVGCQISICNPCHAALYNRIFYIKKLCYTSFHNLFSFLTFITISG